MQRGYSLIELLVVLATAMVLTAIAIPMMQDALVRANVSSLATDAKAVEVAFKQYYMDHNQSTHPWDNHPPTQQASYHPGDNPSP